MAGSGRGAKRTAGDRRAGEAVEPERPPVLPSSVPCGQVPTPAVVHERVRLDLAAAGDSVAAPVAEAHGLEVAARGGQHGQVLGIDGRPGDRKRDRRRSECPYAPAEVTGEHLLELQQRAHGGLLDAGHRRPRRRTQSDGDRDRLLVVEQQGRHRGARLQPVAAAGAAEGVHRISEPAQAVDVAPDRAAGHLEALGELVAGPFAAPLEQRQQLQQPARGLDHGG